MSRIWRGAIGIPRGACAAALAAAISAAAHAAPGRPEPPPAPIVTALPALVEEADVAGVDWFRVDRLHWAVRIRAAASLAPRQVRLWLDADPSDPGDPATGADRRIEGGVLLRTERGRGARWTQTARVPWHAVPAGGGETEHWVLLPPMEDADAAPGWAVETVDAASGARRIRRPVEGLARLDPAYAAPLSPPPEAPPPEGLSGAAPTPLSVGFDELLANYPWEPSAGPEFAFAALSAPFAEGPARLALRLRDLESGGEAALTPLREWRDGDLRFRWEGETLGLAWTVLAERGADGGLQCRGRLTEPADRERRVQWIWAAELPGGDWGRCEGLDEPHPFKREHGRFEGPPYLMAAAPERGAMIALPDPMEPREVGWFTAPAAPQMGLVFDLALTPRTARFPGRATVACRFHVVALEAGTPPARAAWADLHLRGDPSRGALPPSRAFATFDERWDPQPWQVDLPWPDGWARTEDSARALLQFYAAVQPDSGAREALLSGFRRADGGWALRIGDALTPYGLRLPVSLNPGRVTSALAPWNPAQRMLQRLDLAGGAVTGLWVQVETGYAPGASDAEAAALAATRHPASPVGILGAPAITGATDAAEGWAAWTARPPELRPVFAVRGIAPGAHAAWVCADAFVESARALLRLTPPARRLRLAELRAWAGLRRVLVEDDLDPDDPGRMALEADVLGWGIEWSGPPVEPARRMPAVRLSAAGWQPWGPARSLTPGVRVESFGAAGRPVRHLTVRSESGEAVTAEIAISGVREPVIAVRPFDGAAQWIDPVEGEARLSVPLAAGGVAVVNWFLPTDADIERAALAVLPRPSARMASSNLDAVLAAGRAGWRIEVPRPEAVLFDVPHNAQVRVRNLAGEPGVVRRIRLRAGGRDEQIVPAPLVVEPGGERACAGDFTASEGAESLDVEVEVQRGAAQHTWTFRLPLAARPAVALEPAAGVVRDDAAQARAGSTESGYDPRLAHDGDAGTSWASAWGDEAPWLELTLPRPMRAAGVRFRWPYVRGVAQTPRRISVEVTEAGGEVRAIDAVLTPSGESLVEIPAAAAVGLRVRLSPGDGPPEAPGRLWISEMTLP